MRKGKILFTGSGGFFGRQFVPLLIRDGWEVISPRSKEINLENKEEVDTLFTDHYDAIIHAAMVGKKFSGKNVIDDKFILYQNLMIFENLFRHIDKTDVFINFDSGVSSNDPTDPYGFSKYCISKRVLSHTKTVNLRCWGCFGPHEDKERFFYTNINNYINKKDIIIHKDKRMDFIFVDDLYKILCYYLSDIKIPIPNHFDCVYSKKYYLSEIAEMINKLGDHTVNIIKEEEGIGEPYCGTYNNISLDYFGLEKGIKNCYENFCKRNI